MPTEPKDAPPTPKTARNEATAWSNIGKLSTLGLEIGLTFAGLTLLGWWLDGKWDTLPWLTLAGAAMGIIGTTYKLLKVSASMDRKKPGSG